MAPELHITELEEPIQNEEAVLGIPVVYTHVWEVAVQCEFDNGDITAFRSTCQSVRTSFSPMVLRYDHPMEPEFEVTP